MAPVFVVHTCYSIVSPKNQLQSKWNLVFSSDIETVWISYQPQLGLQVYPCYACRAMFSSKVTFQDHINRREVLMKYKCTVCNETLIFHNRCSLHLHARSHFSLDEGKIDLSNIEIYNIPSEMKGFLPYPGISVLFDVEEDSIEEDCYINTQFYSPDISERGKEVITLKPYDALFCRVENNSISMQMTLKQISNNIPLCQLVTVDSLNELRKNIVYPGNLSEVKEETLDSVDNLESSPPPLVETLIQMPVISKIESLSTDMSTYPRCPECEEPQRCSMKMHFIGKNVPFDEKLKCSLCKYVASTKCSYLAHERIHSNISPFTCPECGEEFESREYLMKHINDVCFHLSKQVRIRCPGKRCGKLFASTTTFSVHFAQHIHTWMQCTVCKGCFESVIAFSEHAKIHSNLCFSDKVFKCFGCKNDSSIIYQDDKKHHLEYHTYDRSRCMYVFVCKFCRNYVRSTTTYAAHLLKCQKRQAMIKQGYSYSLDFCVQCHNQIIFYDNKNVAVCTKCKRINSFNLNPKNITSDNSNVEISNQSNNQKEHFSQCIYRNPQVIVKKLEHEISQSSFSNSDTLHDSNLENENDEMSEKNLSSSEIDIKDSSEIDIKDTSMKEIKADDSPRSSTETLFPSKQEGLKRKRKGAAFVFHTKKVILSNPPEKLIEYQAEEAKPFVGTYYCKMCNFQDTQRDKFHLHIINHRDISTDLQCMECGECFVVKPSLIKHLTHYHKIENTNLYFQSNECYDTCAVEFPKEIMELAPVDAAIDRRNYNIEQRQQPTQKYHWI